MLQIYKTLHQLQSTFNRHLIFGEAEQVLVNKILSYLRNDPAPLTNINKEDLEKDLVSFIDYYDQIGTHKLDKTFPDVFTNWVAILRQNTI